MMTPSHENAYIDANKREDEFGPGYFLRTHRRMVPTAAEEAAFMAQLLQSFDDTFSSQNTPSNPRTPSKPFVPKPNHDLDIDMDAFLEGSDNWDLGDLTLSPIKPVSGSLTSDVCLRNN